MNMGGSCQETTTTPLSCSLTVNSGTYRHWLHMILYSKTMMQSARPFLQYSIIILMLSRSDEIIILAENCLKV